MSALSSPVRFALLGCGRVAGRYQEVFNGEVEGGRVVACCDLDRAKAAAAAANLGGAAVFEDARAMLAEVRPDVVCILSESGHHYDHARLVLESGCNVVIEKPVAMLPDHAYAIGELARSRGLMATVVKQNRWNPAMVALKAAMDAGRFGRVITATIRLRWCRQQSYYEDGWHGTWAMDGGVINQQAIHHIDALQWVCGPLDAVAALGDHRLMTLEADDTTVAALRFANGALGTLEATTAARPCDVEASLSVVGESGMAVIGGMALNQVETWTFVNPLPGDAEAPARFSQVVPTGYGLGHGPYLQAVIDRVAKGDLSPVLAPEDAVKSLEIVHALYASMEAEGWVRMADKPQSRRLGRGGSR